MRVTEFHSRIRTAAPRLVFCCPTGGAEALTPEVLLINMRDSNVSNMIVAFLRLATSAEIRARSDFFAPFVMVSV